MSKEQLGEALMKVAGDQSLTEAFAAAGTLDAKVTLLKEQGFDVDSTDFLNFAQAMIEAKAVNPGSSEELSDEELAGAQGGFFGDVLGAGIGAAVGSFFGAGVGAAVGGAIGYGLGKVVDAAVGAVVKSELYDQLNSIVSVEGVVKGMNEYNASIAKPAP
jgi:predicted ribosomally synthesized peptide with nif11-like leader